MVQCRKSMNTFNKTHVHVVLQIKSILDFQSDRVIDLILKHEDKTNHFTNNNCFKVIIKLRDIITNCLYGNIIQQQT